MPRTSHVVILAFALIALSNAPIRPVPNKPIGSARGINPGRVVWTYDPSATKWSGNTNDGTHWWDPAITDQARVNAMLSQNLRTLTSTTNDADAWDALFRSFNRRRGNGDIGYAASLNKLIAIKINQNPANQSNDNYYACNGVEGDPNAITGSPHLILALVNQLVLAGVQPTNIIVCDPTSLNHSWGGPRTIGDSIYVYVTNYYPRVRFVDGVGLNGRELAAWPATNSIAYPSIDDGRFGGNTNVGFKIAQQILDAGFLINMAILKHHGIPRSGPTLCAKNYYGCIAGQRHGPTYGVTANGYSNLIPLMGHQDLGEKTMLFMIDGLYGANAPSADPIKWKMNPFNHAWPSSLFLSEDAVAIDSVGLDFLISEWGFSKAEYFDGYLTDAAAITNAAGAKPSGIVYAPNAGSSTILGSLGVHEHWNNDQDKQYSRNLGIGNGIELVALVAPFKETPRKRGHF